MSANAGQEQTELTLTRGNGPGRLGHREHDGSKPQEPPHPAKRMKPTAGEQRPRYGRNRNHRADATPSLPRVIEAAHGLRQLLQLECSQPAPQVGAITHLGAAGLNPRQVSVRIHVRSVLSSWRLAANGLA